MCIRDRCGGAKGGKSRFGRGLEGQLPRGRAPRQQGFGGLPRAFLAGVEASRAEAGADAGLGLPVFPGAVSYTHLTLPTIYSV